MKEGRVAAACRRSGWAAFNADRRRLAEVSGEPEILDCSQRIKLGANCIDRGLDHRTYTWKSDSLIKERVELWPDTSD